MNLDKPKLNGTSINLTFPSETNKVELERESLELMNYLRSTLKNYNLQLNITVNEVFQKKYAYTDEDKFNTLYEKNPSIALLKQIFDLDL